MAFVQWAQVCGQRYERLRVAALCGSDTGDFSRRGMTMFLTEYSGGRLWTVSRARASFRAREVSVKELLGELGVLKGLSSSAIAVERRQAVP